MNYEYAIIVVIELVCILLSVMIHEISHGLAAYALGDPTAKNAGRLSLNPTKHLDPFGSVVLPLLMLAAGGFVFAYAKPVPYNPTYFKNRRKGELIVAFSGPASNLVQACVGALVCHAIQTFFAQVSGLTYEVCYWLYQFGAYYCLINLVLLFFNIIPLPPLDGASIVALFLSPRGLQTFYRIKRYSMFILLAVLILLPMILGFSPLSWYFNHTAYPLFRMLTGS